jgi:siroheme synthase-like protein
MSEVNTHNHQPVPAAQEAGNTLFPVFLKLEQLDTLLVGGGKVGLEKLQAMLTNAPLARIDIVATEACDEVRKLAAALPTLRLFERPFEEADLDDRDLLVVAVNSKEDSRAIRDLAKARRILVNVADTPEQCDFYLGSIVRKGPLKVAISTNGQSPTAAKRLKEVLQDALPDELSGVIANLNTIRNRLNGDFAGKVRQLNELTQVLVENEGAAKEARWKRRATYALIAFGLMLVGHFIFSYLPLRDMADGVGNWYGTLDPNFGWMVLAGFLAQLVDGALGMGYGVTSAAVLLSAGVNPAAISGSIHTAEMFASGASGYSHYKFGNVNKKLFKVLVLPGVAGAVLGAIFLAKFGSTHADWIRPAMAIYTGILGIRIFLIAFRPERIAKKFKQYRLLAGVGGFLDSFGGGGWGPIVTTTLITRGRHPKYVIGSVSLTEFFVTLSSAFTFFTLLGITHWQVIVALIVGGLVAAPLAARLTGKLPRKTSFILLGLLVMFWSARILVKIL